MTKIYYKEFIEDNFLILDKETQQPVPFKLKPIQNKYYQFLQDDYQDMEGLREIILKARQEGMSSLILALFTVDFIMVPYSVSVCIAHRKADTETLFRKVKFYLESYCQKHGFDVNKYLKSDNKGLIESNEKDSVFFIGTAGSKVGSRGGSAKNILFSVCAFYQDTELITASEIVTATSQQVPQDRGMIFVESTANGTDNYYHAEWQRATRGESNYKHRFFGWQEAYTREWVEKKKGDFPNELLWKQEYPNDPDEAFITSGTPFFDKMVLQKMLDTKAQTVMKGRMTASGEWI